jgi:hypothetical protein
LPRTARAAELAQHQVRGLFRIEKNQFGVGRRIAVGEAQHESIIAPHRFHIRTATGTNAAGDRHGPGRVNAAAERGEHADAPIAHFVARALDHDGAVIWNRGGGNFLVSEKADKVFRRHGIEIVLAGQAAQRGIARHVSQFAHQLADAAAKLERPAGVVPMPERHLARLAGRRRNQHPVVRDLIDAPGRRAQDEGVAGPAFKDHLFVELAHADGLAFGSGEKYAVKPAIGNGAAIQDGQHLGSLARRERIAHPVPGDARPQVGEFVGGIAAGKQIEHAGEGGAREAAEGSCAANQPENLFDANLDGRRWALLLSAPRPSWLSGRLSHDGDDLLRQHVQRVAQKAGRFHQAFVHGARHRGAGDQVGAILGKNDAFAGCAHMVPGPADALHGAGYGRRSLDLHHQVDRAHIDAEFERRGRDQRAQASGLQLLFDLGALRGREGAMVGAGQLLARQFIDRAGQPLGDAAAVDEDDGGMALANDLDQARMDGGPDGSPLGALGSRTAGQFFPLAHAGHVLDRNFNAQVQLLRFAGVDDGDRAIRDHG